MTTDRQLQQQLFDLYEEASNFFQEGMSKQDVVSTFVARNINVELAESIAETGKIWYTERNAYVEKKLEDKVDKELLKHATDAAISMDKGIPRHQVITGFLAQGMSENLAEYIVITGDSLYKEMTEAVVSIKNGKPKNQVIDELVAQGKSTNLAEYIVTEGQIIYKKLSREYGQADMLKGVGIAAVGLVLSYGSYLITGEGGRYFIANGAIFIVSLLFVKGLWQNMYP